VLVEVTTPEASRPRAVHTLAVLGDSIGVGIGDPVAGGEWRGFAPLLAEAMGAARLLNLSTSGARIGSVRTQQLAAALDAGPDAAVLMAGMNDTMRSDFDPVRLADDLDRVMSALTALGTTTVAVRYHDHSKVFRLPGPLRRMLTCRIDAYNAALDAAAARHGVWVLDLGLLPHAYERAYWSVDRLHPSELGYRMLARGLAERFLDAGVAVPDEISPHCSGGVPISTAKHVGWLVFKGIPWLCRRGRDLVPHAVATMLRDAMTDPVDPTLADPLTEHP
jgi:lysophospholipase L1-like esterase